MTINLYGKAEVLNELSTSRRRWMIVATLFLIQVVNYFDKSVLGLAAKPLMTDLGISFQRYGLLASSFFALYAATGLLVAFVAAPRMRPGSILSVLLVVWSLAQLPAAFATTFSIVMLSRVLLGMGEGPGVPTSFNASHEWFLPEERNLPAAIIMFGSLSGSLIAAPVLSHVIVTAGWRAAFLTCSGLGAVALVLWLWVDSGGPYAAARATHDAPPLLLPHREIWKDGTVIGILVVGFCSYWISGFGVAWLAPYVASALGYGLIQAGWILSVVYLGQAMLLLSLSYLSERLLRQGMRSRAARGIAISLCLAGAAGAFVLAATLHSPVAKLIAIAFAVGLPNVVYPLSSAMLSEITPDAQRNQIVTIVFSVITLSGILSPLITGRLVARGPEGWHDAFLLHGGVALIGGLAGYWLLRPDRSIRRLGRYNPPIEQGVVAP